MTHPPGLIVLPCQEQARYHRFTYSLGNLEKPAGTHIEFGIGMSVTDNLNTVIREHLRDEDEWVWVVGDDHYFDPNTLMKLLERDEDIIAPLCTYRMPPYGLVHYQDRIMDTEVFNQVQFSDLPTDDEPFEVERSGSLMLIRRNVLEAIGDPWYGHTHWRISEDIYFCEQAREHGFRVMVDPEVTVAHIANLFAYPQKRDGVWGLVLDYGHGYSAFFPGGLDQNEAAMGKLEAAAA